MKSQFRSLSVMALIGAAISAGIVLGAGAVLKFHHSRSAPAADVPRTNALITKPADESPPSEELALPLEDRKFIWDAEHDTLELSSRAIPRLTAALKDGNLDALNRLFHAQFKGFVPDLAAASVHTHGPAEFRMCTAEPESASTLNSSEFCTRLFEYRGLFANLVGVQLAVMSMSSDATSEADGLPNGTWKLRLWGTAGSGGPRELVMTGRFAITSASPEALDSQGWLAQWYGAKAELRTAPAPLMEQVAEARGIHVSRLYDTWEFTKGPPPVVTGGAFVCDYDNDGWFDVLIVDRSGTILYRGGPGGYFTDATAAANVLPFSEGTPKSAAWFDFDNDGFDDLLIGKRALRNCGTGHFVDVSSEVGLDRLPTASGYAVADYDGDGWADLYVAVSSPGPKSTGGRRSSWLRDETAPGNQLWRNNEGRFENVTDLANASAGHRSTFTAAWLDADGDGRPDLAVIDEFGSPVLLRNRGDGSFDERPLCEGFGGFCMGVAAGDLDDDGRPDLYLANMYSKAGNRIFANLRPDAYPAEVYSKIMEFTRGSELLQNAGNGRFEKRGVYAKVNDVGWAYGPCMLDLDNDGRLDLYAPAGFQSITRNEPDG